MWGPLHNLTLQINKELDKQTKKKKAMAKEKEEAISLLPVRKSRRLMGEAPEVVPDEFFMREATPYIPPKSEKEQLQSIEGTIVTILRMCHAVVLRWRFRCLRTGYWRRHFLLFRCIEAGRRQLKR